MYCIYLYLLFCFIYWLSFYFLNFIFISSPSYLVLNLSVLILLFSSHFKKKYILFLILKDFYSHTLKYILALTVFEMYQFSIFSKVHGPKVYIFNNFVDSSGPKCSFQTFVYNYFVSKKFWWDNILFSKFFFFNFYIMA